MKYKVEIIILGLLFIGMMVALNACGKKETVYVEPTTQQRIVCRDKTLTEYRLCMRQCTYCKVCYDPVCEIR